MKALAKKKVSRSPRYPVAFFTSSDDWKADLASSSDGPLTPRRVVRVSKIDARVRGGMNAATTITSGKNDTNALPASATLRSTNSISSMRSQTCQKIVFSAHVRPVSTRRRPRATSPSGSSVVWASSLTRCTLRPSPFREEHAPPPAWLSLSVAHVVRHDLTT